MKICIDLICDEALLLAEAMKDIQSSNIEVSGLTLGNRWASAWGSASTLYKIDHICITEIDAELLRLSKSYGISNPSEFIAADRFVTNLSRKSQYEILINTFLVVEQCVKDGVELFVTTGVAYLYNLVILAVCERFGKTAVSLYGTRQPDARFTFSTGTGGNWDLVTETFLRLKSENDKDLFQARVYIEKFREDFLVPEYMKSKRQKGGLQPIFIKEFILRCKRWFVDKWSCREDYITQSPFWYAKRDLYRIANKLLVENSGIFDSVDYEDEYFIFPIHLQPEASTLVLGKYYDDQLTTIKNISKCLPLDAKLYVKEHPAAAGRNTLAFYRELRKLFNVRIIDHRVSSKHLLNGSKGVIVISGTMGWESFLLKKPTFVLGDVFYKYFSGVNSPEGFKDLADFLNGRRSFEVSNDDDILRAVTAISDGSYPGLFDVHKLDTSEKVLNAENIRNVSAGLKDIISVKKGVLN